MQEFDDQNITLIHYTVDDFGAIGYMVISYYYNSDNVTTMTDEIILSRTTETCFNSIPKGKIRHQD